MEDRNEISQRGRLDEHFTNAVSQLSSERIAEKLGGIYALESLASEIGAASGRLDLGEEPEIDRTEVEADDDTELVRELEDGIGDDSELFGRSWRADGARLAERVARRASSKSVQTVFTASGESNRRRRAYDAVQGVSKWFGDPARGRNERPHIVALIDETGRVIARDTDPNRMVGEPLLGQVPVLRGLFKRGGSRYGVWWHDNKLLQIGVAAVRNEDGGIVGALLVGYDLSNGYAKQEARLLGHDLLFITPEGIYSTSTAVDVRDALEKAQAIPADAIIFDLEDAVAAAEKLATRGAVVAALGAPRTCRGYVRINALDTEFAFGDLEAVVAPGVDGIVVPKIETAEALTTALISLSMALRSSSEACLPVSNMVRTASIG